jgi:hypothetical protein
VPAFLYLIAHFLLVFCRFLFQGFRQLTRLRHPNLLWGFLLWISETKQISAGIKSLGEVSSTSKLWGWRQTAGLNR